MQKAHTIKPMQIQIPDADIEDLHQRLKNTRWPPPTKGSDWQDGTDATYLHDLISYWLENITGEKEKHV